MMRRHDADPTRRRTRIPSTLGIAAALLCLLTVPALASAAGGAPADTLITVNGDPITSADMDRMIMEAHSTMSMDEEAGVHLTRLLDKRVNDLLILQNAVAMGMDEDPGFLDVLNRKNTEFAIQKYLDDHFEMPKTVDRDSVRAYFERYYWKIQIRQLSVRTKQQAEEMRAAVLAGSSMDTLAQAVSLDTRKLKGGLHNLVYWADLENVFRDQVRGLAPGELSGVFPFREAYSFVRVERTLPLNESDFPRFEKVIRLAVREKMREDSRQAFFDALLAEHPIVEHEEVLAGIRADSALVLSGDFLIDDPAAVLSIPGGPILEAGELRQAISHETMQNGTSAFASNLARAIELKSRRLVLTHVARQLGYFERPDVVAQYEKDWEDGLIQGYLAETVTDRIVFSREKFNQYYEENKELNRGPDEVRLDILILKDRKQAEEAARRLADGADFGFIWQEYQPAEIGPPGESKFVKESLLSAEIRDELAHMEEGDASQVLDMPMGYMIFVLDARRPGQVPSVEEMNMGIRQALFTQEFNRLLDEHLSLLKERSEIRRWPDRIEKYFNPEGETR